MAAVQFADEFTNQIGEIVSVIYERNERGVFVAHGFPINAVHVRRVKEIAHLPPALEVNLVPFGVAIEPHVEAFELELVILAGLLVLCLDLVFGQIDDGVILVDLDQHLLAVARDLILIDIAKNGLFAIFQAVSAKVVFSLIGLTECLLLVFLVGDRAAEIKDPIIHQSKIAVIGRLDFKSHQAVVNAIGVDLDRNRLLLLRVF